MDTHRDLAATLIDIARSTQPPGLRRSQLLAGFASAKDARLFASLKREEGLQVTVVPGRADSPYLVEVHSVVRSL